MSNKVFIIQGTCAGECKQLGKGITIKKIVLLSDIIYDRKDRHKEPSKYASKEGTVAEYGEYSIYKVQSVVIIPSCKDQKSRQQKQQQDKKSKKPKFETVLQSAIKETGFSYYV